MSTTPGSIRVEEEITVGEVSPDLVTQENPYRVQLGLVEGPDIVEFGVLLDARQMPVEVLPNRLRLHFFEDLLHDVDPELRDRHERFDPHARSLQLLDLVLEDLVLVRLTREVRDAEALRLGDQELEKRRDVRVGSDVQYVFGLAKVHDVDPFVHLRDDVAVRDAHDPGQGGRSRGRVVGDHDLIALQPIAWGWKRSGGWERKRREASLGVVETPERSRLGVLEDAVHIRDDDLGGSPSPLRMSFMRPRVVGLTSTTCGGLFERRCLTSASYIFVSSGKRMLPE